MNSAKKIAKLIQTLIDNPQFASDLYSQTQHESKLYQTLGWILAYHIATRDKKTHSANFYLNLSDNLYSLSTIPQYYQKTTDFLNEKFCEIFTPKNKKYKQSLDQALRKNCIDNGFLTHSFNGFNLENIKKYGLGSSLSFDKELNQDLCKLEEFLGKNEYKDNQSNTTSEIYFCTAGAKSFYYASSASPERLFNGPLKQNPNEALPIILGETTKQYMMRVAQNKINKLLPLNQQNECLEIAIRVIDKLCSHKPAIAILPIHSKKYEIHASRAIFSEESMPIDKKIEERCPSPLQIFSTIGSDELEPNELGDLVCQNTTIPKQELAFIEVPNRIEILQNIAFHHGLKLGDKIDFFTGQQYIVNPTKNNKQQKDTSLIKENQFEK